MVQADADYKPPNITAYSLAVRVVEVLESATAADKRGQPLAASAFRTQADRLRARLAVTPACSRSDRIAHLALARRAGLDLVGALLPAIAEKDLAGRARELLNLLERLADETPGEDLATHGPLIDANASPLGNFASTPPARQATRSHAR